MNKTDLAKAIAPKLGVDVNEASHVINVLTEEIAKTVIKGEKVTIYGFGVFESKQRAARVARNPMTGEKIPVDPTVVPIFRPGVIFKELMNKKLKINLDDSLFTRKVINSRITLMGKINGKNLPGETKIAKEKSKDKDKDKKKAKKKKK